MPGAGSCFTPHGVTKGQGLFFAALGGQWPRHREVTYFSQDHTAREPGSPGPEPTRLAATLRGHVLDPPEPETTLDSSIHTSKVDTYHPNLQMRKMRVNGVRLIPSVTPGHLAPCVGGRHRGEPPVAKELQRCSHTSVCAPRWPPLQHVNRLGRPQSLTCQSSPSTSSCHAATFSEI